MNSNYITRGGMNSGSKTPEWGMSLWSKNTAIFCDAYHTRVEHEWLEGQHPETLTAKPSV